MQNITFSEHARTNARMRSRALYLNVSSDILEHLEHVFMKIWIFF